MPRPAAEDRIEQLEGEIARAEDRAARAESWLHLIHTEIEQPRGAGRSGPNEVVDLSMRYPYLRRHAPIGGTGSDKFSRSVTPV